MTSLNIPQLTICTATGKSHLRLADAPAWTFGRGDDNTVPLSDSFASRHHAMIQVIDGNRYFYTDLNSRNGSLINDQPVTKPMLLRHGDRIAIGSTTLIFEHNPYAATDFPRSDRAAQVLILHGSMLQGEIWQKVLESQDISVLLAESSSLLKQHLELSEVSGTLPQLLLIDLKPFSGNPYPFCRWCSQNYPQIRIFLMDSLRQHIPKLERQVALKNGVLNLFPAMSRSNLILRTSEILASANEVLNALECTPLSKADFLMVLRTIENLIGHTFTDQSGQETAPDIRTLQLPVS